MSKRKIEKKNIAMIYVLTICTLGIWPIFWYVSSKRDMNAMGADIPSSWLIIVPVANMYWIYKYCKAFSEDIRKDDNTIMWFLVTSFAGIVMPYVVQKEINDQVDKRSLHHNKKRIEMKESQAKQRRRVAA